MLKTRSYSRGRSIAERGDTDEYGVTHRNLPANHARSARFKDGLGYHGTEMSPNWQSKLDPRALGRTGVFDSAETPFFLRQLEHIMTKVHNVIYTKLKGKLFVPVNTEVPPGATNWTWRQFDKVGIARIIRDYSADLSRVDILGTEFYNNPIVSVAASFGYNRQEIRSAGYTGFPLDQRRAMAGAEAIERLIDDLIFFGDPRTKLGGFITNANMTQISLPADGAGNSVSWDTKTADQILRDMNLIANTIVSLTREVEEPDTMILPTGAYSLASTKRIGIDSNMTVLKYFLETSPYIKDVDKSVKLVGAGNGGYDRIMCYERNAEKLEVIIPMEVTQYEVQERGLEMEVPLEARYGGVAVYKPLSLAYADMPSITA